MRVPGRLPSDSDSMTIFRNDNFLEQTDVKQLLD